MKIERRHFDIIDSTATWARQNAHLLPRDKMTLVTAEGQLSGRGRFKRRWVSPPGQNIYATFCHFVDKKQSGICNIPQILALSVISVLEKLGFHPELKWPNDIKLAKKKVGGILAETTMIQDQICMMVSIGLNINMTAESFKEINQPVTSLLVEKGHPFDLEDILHDIRLQYLKELELFNEEGFAPFLETYRNYICKTKQVRFNDGRTVWEGAISAINSDGTLSLKLASGEIKTFLSGEIED